jgi:hypothetical protein
MTVQSMNVLDHSGCVDTTDEEINANVGIETTAEVLPPAEIQQQEPAPPGVGAHPGTALFVAITDSQPRIRKDKVRRGRPPVHCVMGHDRTINGDIGSPTRICNKRTGYKEESPDKRPALSSTAPATSSSSSSGPPAPLPLARSVSPGRSLGELTLPIAGRDLALRPSGSAPNLPPLPPLLAPTRGPVRSRSSVGLHEARVGEAFQPSHRSDRGAPQMFRTAPLAVSSDRDRDRDRDGNANMRQGPPPPTLAPPPQRPAAPQNMVPPPPQRQISRDDPGGVRLAPKLPASVSGQQESRHWREPTSGIVRGLEAASAVPEGWCDVDARLSSARLQSVV